MAISRFKRPTQLARFNPLSFEEMSFAPVALRTREDALNNSKDELLNQLHNLEVPEMYQEEFNTRKQGLLDKIDQLSQRVNKEGVGNLEILGDFRNLRNEYNKDVSKSGSIGMAQTVLNNVRSAREDYYKIGMQKNWNPDTIDKNWQKEVEKYNAGLPSELSKYKGSIPDFIPTHAPNKIDAAAAVSKLAGLVRDSGLSQKKVTYERVTDADGNSYYEIREDGEAVSTNNESVDKLQKFVNTLANDPNSDLRRSLEYQGISIEDFLNHADEMSDIMRATKIQTVDSKRPTGGGGGGSGSAKPTKPEEDATGKVIRAGSRIHKVLENQSSTALKESIKDIRRDVFEGNLSEDEANTRTAFLLDQVRKKEKDESEPEIRAKINNTIQQSELLKRLDINNYEDYKKFLNSPKAEEIVTTQSTYSKGQMASAGLGPAESTQSSTSTLKDIVMTQVEHLYAQELRSNPTLVRGDYYQLGVGSGTTKLRKELNTGIQLDHVLQKIATDGAGILSSGEMIEDMNTPYTEIGLTTNPKEYENFASVIQAMDSPKMEIVGINTGSAYDRPSIALNISGKVGDGDAKYQVALDLKKDDWSADVLSTLEEGLGAASDHIVHEIRDKINYNTIPVELPEEFKISEKTTKSLQNHSEKASREMYLPAPTDEDSPVNEFLFVKKDGANYNMGINDDGSFTTYRTEGDRTIPIEMKDVMKKVMAQNYVISTKGLGTMGDLAHNSQYKNEYIPKFMKFLANNDSVIYSTSDKFKSTIREMKSLLEGPTPSQEEFNRKASALYQRIANSPVRSKVRKFIL